MVVLCLRVERLRERDDGWVFVLGNLGIIGFMSLASLLLIEIDIGSGWICLLEMVVELLCGSSAFVPVLQRCCFDLWLY